MDLAEGLPSLSWSRVGSSHLKKPVTVSGIRRQPCSGPPGCPGVRTTLCVTEHGLLGMPCLQAPWSEVTLSSPHPGLAGWAWPTHVVLPESTGILCSGLQSSTRLQVNAMGSQRGAIEGAHAGAHMGVSKAHVGGHRGGLTWDHRGVSYGGSQGARGGSGGAPRGGLPRGESQRVAYSCCIFYSEVGNLKHFKIKQIPIYCTVT